MSVCNEWIRRESRAGGRLVFQIGLMAVGVLSGHACGGEPQNSAGTSGETGTAQQAEFSGVSYRGTSFKFGDAPLTENQYLASADGHNILVLQAADCNLVLYNDQVGAVWASNTNGRTTGCRLVMGLFNNLILQDTNNDYNTMWQSPADGSPGGIGDAALVMQSYVRGFTIEKPGPSLVWASSSDTQSWAQANPSLAFAGSAPGTTVIAFLGFGGFGSPDPNPPAAGCVFDHSRELCCFSAMLCKNVWVCGWNYSNLTVNYRESDWTACGVCLAPSC